MSNAAKPLLVAVAGSPNCGKTTLFNALTGLRQKVGNYPGVTIEKIEVRLAWKGQTFQLVDLPGIYSLTAHSPEEKAARDFLLDEQPDLVVNVVDASNLERSLYLTTQLIELNLPLVVVFNMMDQAGAAGLSIDVARFSALLGLPVVRTVAHKGRGLDDLKQAIADAAGAPPRPDAHRVLYGEALENELRLLEEKFGSSDGYKTAGRRWTAVKLLEHDETVWLDVLRAPGGEALCAAADEADARCRRAFGDSPGVLVADHRYGFINGACQEAVHRSAPERHAVSDRLDRVLLHDALGLPLFLGLMFLVFKLTFALGAPLMTGIEHLLNGLSGAIAGAWPAGRLELLRSLLVDGIIGGVGGVVVFLPTIMLLFASVAFLEDSGYMARAAFIMDRFMHKIGLHGKSFIPMVIGFGCSVPAILATRILETRRDRLITMFIIPLISCGARFPIYMLIIPAFFPQAWQAPMLFTIYLIGILLALLCARLLSRAVFKGTSTPFVMELPPYRLPTARGILFHTWERGWMYLRKAGTIILGISIVLWALTTYPRPADVNPTLSETEQRAEVMAQSAAGRIGRALEPVLKPMGFDWKIGTALIGAFAAKEVFVAQMGIVFASGEEDERGLREKLREAYTPLIGFCVMLFCLVGSPCMATVAATRSESKSWRWALAQFGGLTLLAWLLTTLVYQGGRLLGG